MGHWEIFVLITEDSYDLQPLSSTILTNIYLGGDGHAISPIYHQKSRNNNNWRDDIWMKDEAFRQK